MTLRLEELAALTFDFGNTLVPVGRDALRRVVELTAEGVARTTAAVDREAFLLAWAEERDRQFRENVPAFRDVDIAERLVRVFARLRGMPSPVDGPWDQQAAAARSDAAEVDAALDAYSRAFIDGMPPRPEVTQLLRALHGGGRRLAILSNWPLAVTVDRYADAHGWSPSLDAIVVSERVGVIKPHPAIFEAARLALGGPDVRTIAHVGDDWAADVIGAANVGWRTVWIADRPGDTPLPTSDRDGEVEPDLVIDELAQLGSALGLPVAHAPMVVPHRRRDRAFARWSRPDGW